MKINVSSVGNDNEKIIIEKSDFMPHLCWVSIVDRDNENIYSIRVVISDLKKALEKIAL